MARNVFDNTQLAHVWANQNVSEGRSNNGNFYFRGPVLYSYGSHFVVGVVLPGVGPVITADGYSNSTAKHIGAAERATSYIAPNLPRLTNIADDLLRQARDPSPANARPVMAYVESNAARLEDKAGEMLLRLAKSRAAWPAFKARALAKAERRAEAERKAQRDKARKRAAELAVTPLEVVKARALASANGSGPRIAEMVSDYRAAHLAAGGPRIKAAVWQRLKAVRAIAKRAENRPGYWTPERDSRRMARQGLSDLRRIALRDWTRAGDKAEPGARYPFGRAPACALLEQSTQRVLKFARMPTSIRAKLERQLRIAEAAGVRVTERHTRAQRKAEARKQLRRTVESLRIMRDDAGADPAAFFAGLEAGQRLKRLAWLDSRLSQFIAAGRFPALRGRLEALRAGPVAEALESAEHAQRAAQAEIEAKREAWNKLSPEDKREAWRNGDSLVPDSWTRFDLSSPETGPLLRARGAVVQDCTVAAGELETSEGARVPLRHAFRVFQFVASCRAAGRVWFPADAGRVTAWGPRRIRVGHFAIDRIDSTGDFKAGCHSIKWAEVQLLAERLGVAGCLADPETISGELESAA